MNLLSKYGGIWIDSTVFLNENVSELNKYELFTVKHDLYSSWHVCQGKWTGFFFGAGKNNLGIKLVSEILNNYAISENYLIAYLLVDAVITVAYENVISFKKQIDAIPVNNKKIFCMEKLLNTPAKNFRIPSKINKLSYKRKYINEINGLNTVYNLLINDSEINIKNGREIKEYIRKQFNVILNKNGWSDCMDSTSVLTTEKRHFTKGNHTEFSIDLAIVFNNRDGWHRLIHDKTGFAAWDRYCWNIVPNSRDLFDKVTDIKDEHLWNEVIDVYLEKKNMYLRRQDYNHPSFNVYVEAVNQVFNKYFD